MRFLFVDRITEITENEIRGLKFFGDTESLRYGPEVSGEIAPGVISEAIGQLASWHAINRNEFTARPVFLFADRIEILKPVFPSSQVELCARIDSMDKETMVFSGEAYVDGNIVHRVSNINGFFMPLAKLEDPHVTRTRFNQLITRGMNLTEDVGVFEFESLVDEVDELKTGTEIIARKYMAADEPFYMDHFPRYPVTPIVMINEMIGQATQKMMGPREDNILRPKVVKSIKIKDFVRPEEGCEIRVKLKGRRTEGDYEIIETMAEITKEGKRILRGSYEYSVGGASA